jgi:Methylamine utilisation protein MauE
MRWPDHLVLSGGSRWWLVEVNAATASVLLVAGIGKLYSPAQPRRALRELFSVHDHLSSITVAIRLLAVVELISGIGLLESPTRIWAAAGAAVLGLGFIAFGAIGWLRHSQTSCGCLAASDGHPLGPTNVAVGAVLVAVAAANGLLVMPSSFGRTYTAWAVLGAALDVLFLTVWVYRRMTLNLLRRSPVGMVEPVPEGLR